MRGMAMEHQHTLFLLELMALWEMVDQPLTIPHQVAAAEDIMVVELVLQQAVAVVVVTLILRYVAALFIPKAHKLALEP